MIPYKIRRTASPTTIGVYTLAKRGMNFSLLDFEFVEFSIKSMILANVEFLYSLVASICITSPTLILPLSTSSPTSTVFNFV